MKIINGIPDEGLILNGMRIIPVVPILTGTAQLEDVRANKTFYRNDALTKLTGNMPDVSADIDPTGTPIVIPLGYHDGTKHVLGDTDLITGNVKAGINIYGVDGATNVIDTTQIVSPIDSGHILNGFTGYVNGASVVGMLSLTGDAIDGHVLLGDTFYSNDALVQHTGTLALTGTAIADQVLAPETFYSTDALTAITGTMVHNIGDTTGTDITNTSTTLRLQAPVGYYDGTNDYVTVTDIDFITDNIKAGINLFGIDGATNTIDTTELVTPIQDIFVIVGYIGYVNGALVTGVNTGVSVLTGTAITSQVLSLETFYSNDALTQLTGTMVHNAGDTTGTSSSITGTTLQILAPEGYYNGISDNVTVDDIDFVVGSIAAGVDIFGLTGTYVTTLTGTAVSAHVLDTDTFYSNDATTQLTGLMVHNTGDVTNTGITNTSTTLKLQAPIGYYDGTSDYVTATDSEYVTGNIRAGRSIFGVTGATNTIDTTEVTSPITDADVAVGKIGFVNGSVVTGTSTGGTGGMTIDGIIESYVVQAGTGTISAGDFVGFVNNLKGNSVPVFMGASYNVCSCQDSGGVMFVYADYNSSQILTAVYISFTGNLPVVGTAYPISTGATDVESTICKLDTNKFLLSYPDSTNSSYLTGVVLTVSAGVITKGTIYELSQIVPRNLRSISMSTDKCMLVYRDTSNSYYGTAVIITTSGYVPTFNGTSLAYDAVGTVELDVTQMNSTEGCVHYTTGSNSPKVVILSATGTVVSAGTINNYTATPLYTVKVGKMDTDKILLIGNRDGYGLYATVGEIAAGVITTGTGVQSEILISSNFNIWNSFTAIGINAGVFDCNIVGIPSAVLIRVSGTVPEFIIPIKYSEKMNTNYRCSCLISTNSMLLNFCDAGQGDEYCIRINYNSTRKCISSYGTPNTIGHPGNTCNIQGVAKDSGASGDTIDIYTL